MPTGHAVTAIGTTALPPDLYVFRADSSTSLNTFNLVSSGSAATLAARGTFY